MNMIQLRGRNQPPAQPASLAHVSHETAQYFQRAAEIEAECEELRDTVARLKQQADERDAHLRAQMAERDRTIEFLERQVEVAEGKRDRYALRATEAETTLRIVSQQLIDAAERARVAAAAMDDQAEPPRGKEGATDLDEVPSFLKQGPQDEQS